MYLIYSETGVIGPTCYIYNFRQRLFIGILITFNEMFFQTMQAFRDQSRVKIPMVCNDLFTVKMLLKHTENSAKNRGRRTWSDSCLCEPCRSVLRGERQLQTQQLASTSAKNHQAAGHSGREWRTVWTAHNNSRCGAVTLNRLPNVCVC